VHRLHSSGLVLWELVAESPESEVVGHVIVSRSSLDDGSSVTVLSPLAVRPNLQRTGYGRALVDAVCDLAQGAGEQCVLLQGNPAYYGRLGFDPSASVGITMDLPDWAPREAAQIRRLAAWDGTLRGQLVETKPFVGLE
jgi:putative acetyltransferase